ncbi:halocyanin domain-containing protein [Halobacteria archaeon AArc-m2/3/4]|uniref:Halocyanin domain-containing protein n=1 Tax=Natronoglomus mannanivorans TaxID=2979990 RepID=A0AAP2Z523_9EURY|nr:halocyanin domain-containing protein [Halobacteria archaeon AArc-xg1-1]MCU4972083.1 halocyanin domain-containing protein [Halobacteria archaeon AArc-m2/3/4]
MNRRTFLAGAGASAVALTVGTSAASAQDDSFDGWLEDVPNYDGVVDYTGEDEVHVTVGADDGFTFAPAAIRVDPGTTVVWEWTGEGGGHDVVDEDGAFESEFVSDAGHEFEHTFDEEGVSLYGCTPHIPMGMKGAVVVGDAADEAPTADAPAQTAGGLQSVPVLPGTAAALGIIAGVTVAISRWTSAGRDEDRLSNR